MERSTGGEGSWIACRVENRPVSYPAAIHRFSTSGLPVPNSLVDLRLFGGVVLAREGRAVRGRATQRRRLGVLVLLAGAPHGQLSRDKLIAYLWPDADTESARHLLTGAVYELRKALGDDVIVSRGDELALDSTRVATDVARFVQALEAGEHQAAVRLYQGPFADGFYVSHASEFERWLEETRSRYARLYRDALLALALEQERQDPRAAAALWERLAREDLADAPTVLRAMEALNAAAQGALALRLAEHHATHLRREFDSAADPEIAALARRIRQRPAHSAEPPAAPAPLSIIDSRNPAPRLRRAVLGLAGVAGLVALVALAGGLSGRTATEPGTRAAVESVSVAPFELPPEAPAELGQQVATLVRHALERAGMAVAAGTRSGSGHGVVRGRVEEWTGTLRVQAALETGPTTRSPVAEAVGEPGKVAELADRLTLALLTSWPNGPEDRLRRVAAESTDSLAAFAAWVVGEREYRAGRFLAASEAFARAAATDTGFALAHYRLSLARLSADFPETDIVSAERAMLASLGRLAERDRLLLRAYAHYRSGEPELAEQRYQALTARYPDDAEAWLQLGETRFHYHPLRGLPISDAAEPFRRALALDPGNWQAEWHLAHLAGAAGDRERFAASMDRLLLGAPEPAQALDLRALGAIARGSLEQDTALLGELARADELRLFQLAWRAAVFLHDLEAAERLSRMLTSRERPAYARRLGMLSRIHLDLARGRWEGARAGLDALALAGLHFDALVTRGAVLLLPQAEPRPGELRAVAASLDSARKANGPRTEAEIGVLEALVLNASGDSAGAEAIAARLDAHGDQANPLLIRADIAWRAGRAKEALELVTRSTATVGWYGNHVDPPIGPQSHARWIHAEALRALGRMEAARGWYRSFGEFGLGELAYLGRCEMRDARCEY